MSLLVFRASSRSFMSSTLRAPAVSQMRWTSSNSKSNSSLTDAQNTQKSADKDSSSQPAKKQKTQSELDAELMQKMAGLSGDGGDAGVEYEDGVPVSMKRSVKNNMFRYI